MNNSSPLKKNGLFTSPILGLYDKPRQLIVEYYLHWTITFDIFFQQVQTQITTAYSRIIPTLDPVVGTKGGWVATALLSGSASPPPPPPPRVGENLYICRGKLTKIWPTVPNHEKKYSPPSGNIAPPSENFWRQH